jgi:predicted O-methyltransferase YrrM
MLFKNFFEINNPLEKNCFVVDSKEELIKYYAFTKKEILIEDDLDEIRFIEDLNSRRRRDAEVLSLVAANAPSGTMLDIGTHLGRSSARMAVNSPQSTIYTVNVQPDDFRTAGRLTTEELTLQQIGSYYREKGLSNIKQIYANTNTWNIPNSIDQLSLVYVDGCHDKKTVYSDTKRVLQRVKHGGFILWHDCSPIYRGHFHWIHEVMCGIEQLFQEKVITGHILNVRNSWIGVYKNGQ